jgi:hypothetical protein
VLRLPQAVHRQGRHRIREAIRSGDLAPIGGAGGIVEVDETFIGREPGKPVRRVFHHKMKVLTLVDRETKQARSMVVDNIKPATIAPILRENMAHEARLATDEGGHYLNIGHKFAGHGVVRYRKEEYVVGETIRTRLKATSRFQTRDEGCVPALRQAALASLSC